jgi:hypothetical protein
MTSEVTHDPQSFERCSKVFPSLDDFLEATRDFHGAVLSARACVRLQNVAVIVCAPVDVDGRVEPRLTVSHLGAGELHVQMLVGALSHALGQLGVDPTPLHELASKAAAQISRGDVPP